MGPFDYAFIICLQDTPQASTQFSPFQLVYGHKPLGLMQILRECWEEAGREEINIHTYRGELLNQLETVQRVTNENLEGAQQRQKASYDKAAKPQDFQAGDKVLVLFPTSTNNLLTKWQSPFKIIQKAGPIDYEVSCPGHMRERQIFHINILWAWKDPGGGY